MKKGEKAEKKKRVSLEDIEHITERPHSGSAHPGVTSEASSSFRWRITAYCFRAALKSLILNHHICLDGPGRGNLIIHTPGSQPASQETSIKHTLCVVWLREVSTRFRLQKRRGPGKTFYSRPMPECQCTYDTTPREGLTLFGHLYAQSEGGKPLCWHPP